MSKLSAHNPSDSDMDTAIDLSDASKALDLDNIRFQLMYVFLVITARKQKLTLVKSPGGHNHFPLD